MRIPLQRSSLSLLPFLIGFLVCAGQATAQCAGVPPSTVGAVTWTAQWCDEFNGGLNSPINSANWTFDTGNSGFGNNELETYCDPSSNTAPCNSSTPNAYIDGSGHLAIQVLSPSANTWTSARLKTQGLRTFNFGRIEASLMFPSHAGLWPAFWMLGSQPGVSWPSVGESDIMENWPATSNIGGPGATGNRSTIHTQLTGGSGKGGAFTFPAGQQVDTAFHTYGQIWSANTLQFYVDDPAHPFFIVTPSDLPTGDMWPFTNPSNPFFLIMNMAVGGTLGTPVDAQTGSQAPMLVDYVRQYTAAAPPAPMMGTPPSISVKAGATTGNTSTFTPMLMSGTGYVYFSCTTTAPKASCAISTTDSLDKYVVSADTSETVTVTATTTTNTSSADVMLPPASRPMNKLAIWLPLAMGLLIPASAAHGHMRRRKRLLVCALFLAIILLSAATSCGGGNNSTMTTTTTPSGGTTPGSYVINVYAFTESNAGDGTNAHADATGAIPLTVK
ncbi:MAG: glycoside hydrolase family 16 protein [Terriglobales bacterium]